LSAARMSTVSILRSSACLRARACWGAVGPSTLRREGRWRESGGHVLIELARVPGPSVRPPFRPAVRGQLDAQFGVLRSVRLHVRVGEIVAVG
jgi:hypothetical protein